MNSNTTLKVWSGTISIVMSLSAGCADTSGPNLILNSHIDYNKAVHQVVSEELLLNIVRRRYGEPPQFVQISSISTSIGMSADVGGNASWNNSGSGNKSRGVALGAFNQTKAGSTDSLDLADIGVSGGVSFSDSPTVTITPLSGTAISGPLTKRMSYATIGKLADSGYRPDMVLALMVEDFTNIRGPYMGIGDSFRPGMPEYVELITRIGKMFESNELVIGTWRWEDPYSNITYAPDQIKPENQIAVVALGDGVGRWRSIDGGKSYSFTDKSMYAAMYIPEASRSSPDGARIIELLNLQPEPLKKIWNFQPAKVLYGPDLTSQADEPRSDVKMLVRSFYSVMNLLAYGVHVPPEDVASGRAIPTDHFHQAVKNGQAFDVNNMFTVHWSESKPNNAYVSIRHHGRWFYIDNKDYRSKVAFSGLYDLFNLEVVPTSSSSGPVLTLPVN